MRFRALVAAAGCSAALAPASAAVAAGQDGYRHGRVRFVESGVTLHRATEVSAEEALANLPFLPGDRVWTDAYGRAEFQFPDGTLVRLDSRSKLDYAGHEEGSDERIVLRLWSGSLIVRLRTRHAARFELETPAGTVELFDEAMVRVDVDSGETRVSVYRGEAALDDGRERVRLAAGERTLARWGEAAAAPEPFEIGPEDDFARWDDARESEERWAARSSEYLPAELDPYAGELERNGSWRFEASVGYVWVPRVAAGWSPYANGHWSWTPYGWTWVPYETWGWAPFHYGRWGFSVGFGWYWAPGRVWGPGWVSWGVGGGYVGWCPLGWRDRPVHPWGGRSRGHAVPRHAGHGGWSVVREGDFGGRDVARRRVPLAGVDPGALRVAESPSLRPTRDARALAAANPQARAISRRPTPGDFVRELAVDNKTTIPSPWLRRGRAPGNGAANRELREQAGAARPRGSVDQRTAARSGSSAPSPPEARARERSASGAPRSLPWVAPRRDASMPRAESAPREGRAARQRDTQALRREPAPRRESTGRVPGGAPAGWGAQRRSRGQAEPPSMGSSSAGTRAAPGRAYRPRPERSQGAARDQGGGSPSRSERAARPARGSSSRPNPQPGRAESRSGAQKRPR